MKRYAHLLFLATSIVVSSFAAQAQNLTLEQKEAIGVATAQANQRSMLNWALNPVPGTLPQTTTVQMPQVQVTQTPLGTITTYPAGTLHSSAVTCVTPETALQMCKINGQWLPMPNLNRPDQSTQQSPPPAKAAPEPAHAALAPSTPPVATPPPISPGGPVKGRPAAGDCQVSAKGVILCEPLPPAYSR